MGSPPHSSWYAAVVKGIFFFALKNSWSWSLHQWTINFRKNFESNRIKGPKLHRPNELFISIPAIYFVNALFAVFFFVVVTAKTVRTSYLTLLRCWTPSQYFWKHNCDLFMVEGIIVFFLLFSSLWLIFCAFSARIPFLNVWKLFIFLYLFSISPLNNMLCVWSLSLNHLCWKSRFT